MGVVLGVANDASARSGRVQGAAKGSKVNTLNNKKMVDVLRNVYKIDTNNRKFSKDL